MAIDPTNLAGSAHLTFDDEFNALSLWTPSNTSGTWATTFWYQDPNGNGGTLTSNGEQEWYINANDAATSSVKPWAANNGVLTITAQQASSSISPLINGYGITSGELNTYHSFSQTYGYFEMKAQLPAGQGFWPAFWLLPESGAWPPELDVMEVLGNNTNVLYNTVHSATNGTTGDGGTAVADMSSGYHTYGVDWESDYITFFFDGHKVYQTATPADMHQPMYMIANLADGGGWPGAATGATGQMNVDYIRAYASGAGPSTATNVGAVADPTSSIPTTTTTPVSSTTSSSTVSAPVSSTTSTSTASAAPPATTTASGTAGQTFTSDNAGDHFTGTAGNDVFNVGRGGDVLTGNGGADVFKFAQVPWAHAEITDFSAQDSLDLSAMLASVGYTGSNPLADGHLKLVADGNGGTQVWFDTAGLPTNIGSWEVVDLDHVAASSLGISNGVITEGGAAASAPTPTSSATAGQTFTSDNAGDHFAGTAGNDVFNVGRGGDVLTGNGGADVFKFAQVPWAHAEITDFSAQDSLDLSAMLASVGYSGSNPLTDGHLKLVSDGNGGTQVWFDTAGLPTNIGSWEVVNLDHVAPSSLSISGGVMTEGGSASSSTSTATTSSATAGQTFTSDNAGDHFTGTAGNDIFNVGRGGDVLTGAGGSDTFVFNQVPWAHAEVTDWSAQDTLDLSHMYANLGYTGSNPVADGHLSLVDDGAGNTQVWFNANGLPSGSGGNWELAQLDHVSASSLHVSGAFITG